MTTKWQVICTKVREDDKRIVRIKEGSPAGRHVVIVDDLVQSGGTLIECQVFLCVLLLPTSFKLNAPSLYLIWLSTKTAVHNNCLIEVST